MTFLSARLEVFVCSCGGSSLFDWRSLAVCAGALLCLSGSRSLVEVGNVAGAAGVWMVFLHEVFLFSFLFRNFAPRK